MDQISYALGVLLGANLKQQGFNELDAASFLKSFQSVLNDEQIDMDINKANQLVQEHMAGALGKANAESGLAFLEENSKREGVISLASGMQYEIMKEGNGPKPSASDKVTTHYHGMLIDGKVFDSSVQRGEPATFPVNGVIAGWVEALQLMSVGSKWKLFIPSQLAYGPSGAGQDIGPNATLIFEVELFELQN